MVEYSAASRIWLGAGSGISTSRTAVLNGSVTTACRARPMKGPRFRGDWRILDPDPGRDERMRAFCGGGYWPEWSGEQQPRPPQSVHSNLNPPGNRLRLGFALPYF